MPNEDQNVPDFVDILTAIIVASRDYLGQAEINRERVLKQASAWLRHCDLIPPDRLWECYDRWVESAPRQGLRATDLKEQWIAIRVEERSSESRSESAIAMANPGTYRCLFCEDWGYQVIAGRGARGCVCEKCPPAQRSRFPLQPPDWTKDVLGQWRRTGNTGDYYERTAA